MRIKEKNYVINQLTYCIRSARIEDAATLSKLRVQIDGETENMDREAGEMFIDEEGFKNIIKEDSEHSRNLFLVAVTMEGRIVGFSRCEGSNLKRMAHKVEFGVCVSKEFWGYKIGAKLLEQSLFWADQTGIQRVILYVLDINDKAMRLYEKYGFVKEGRLRKDKLLSDGLYHDTIVMGRILV